MTVAKHVYQTIELILSDVDGVLTDGAIVFNNEGIESKRFHIRDGLAIKLWSGGGGKFGVLTGRSSHIVNLRAAELGIEIVRQGVENKLAAMKEILAELRLEPAQVCYIGDDLPDLAPMRLAALAITVPDAPVEVRNVAGYVTKLAGGQGAVREAIEVILKGQGRWSDLVQKYDS